MSRRLLAFATTLITLYLVLLTGQRALEAYRVQQEVNGMRQEIETLRARNIALQNELSSGRLDEEMERIARQELGLARPGDKPIVLVWPDRSSSTSPVLPPFPQDVEPNWMRWLRLFLDVDGDVR